MSTPGRTLPPMDADERTTLESWLDFYRTTLALKCDGLTEQQLREASAPPSTLTLLGLVRHLAAVERFWFRRVLLQEDAPTLFSSDPDASSANSGFDLDESATYEDARRIWQTEIEHARKNCASRALEDTGVYRGGPVTLRWIYTHMTAEYARHCGQADLIRERIDGSTGI
ncbi:DinB family protein [Streptomyces rimosus]|uniref:DinB family protein n=1 Tax=Streptomyces rimosus TaxID=1927 RepID=UPI0004C5E42B|nr:DinB family protein [Streptomyces rimosus]